MAPAFRSRRHAAAFGVLLAVLLALPAAVAHTGWLDRRDVYPAIPVKYGPFPWIQQKIFGETGDVDMAFLGSSHIWCAIYAPDVQKALSAKLGREAEVFSLGWPWPGFDALYFIARDLLVRRHVHTLVIYNENGSDVPQLHAARWFRAGEDSPDLLGLPWRARASLYGSAVLGMPRQLLSLVRPNLVEDPAHCHTNFWNTYYHAPNLAEHLGTLRAQLVYGVSPDFVVSNPRGLATPADVRVYSPETSDAFEFTGPPLPTYQLHFAKKLAQLCREKGTRLVILHTPNLREGDLAVVSERERWAEALGAPVDIVGIPPKRLLAGISAEEVNLLFYEDAHFNQNGQDMFTKLVLPSLLEIHAQSTHSR